MKNLVSILSMALFMVLVSCSSEEDGPVVPDNSWRDNLESITQPLSKEPITGWGGQYANYSAGFIIEDEDGRNLMDEDTPGNVLKSGFYFEINGKQYFMGDTINVCGLFNSKVDSFFHYGGGVEMLSPFWMTWQEIVRAGKTIDLTYDFVWPSRNIRKQMRVYIEPNLNYDQEVEAFQKQDIQKEAFIELYKCGFWVDGQPYKTSGWPWYHLVVE